jgi:hypothetical protein
MIHGPRFKSSRSVGNLLCGLREEASRQRTVGVESDPQLAERGEEDGLLKACNRAVVTLVDGREDVAFGFAVVVGFLDVFGGEVGDAESSEDSGFVDFVDAVESLLNRTIFNWGVNVEDVDLLNIGTERFRRPAARLTCLTFNFSMLSFPFPMMRSSTVPSGPNPPIHFVSKVKSAPALASPSFSSDLPYNCAVSMVSML